MPKHKGILADHQRRGKKLITPMNAVIGPLHEVSWITTMIPELLWIAMVQYRCGHRDGVRLITSLARAARKLLPESKRPIFAMASDFEGASDQIVEGVKKGLFESSAMASIKDAITPLVAWYPTCPLRALFSAPLEPDKSQLQIVRDIVSSLYDRAARDPMMVQATVVWLMFDADRLKVGPDLALAKFPEIERYPGTELSRKVGASIRSTLNMIVGSENCSSQTSEWPRAFWNRGLAIEPCEFGDE